LIWMWDFSHAMKDMYYFDMPTISSLNNISILQWKWKSSESIFFFFFNKQSSMEIVSWHGHNTHTHTIEFRMGRVNFCKQIKLSLYVYILDAFCGVISSCAVIIVILQSFQHVWSWHCLCPIKAQILLVCNSYIPFEEM
jgi:hypothetical protein